MYDLETKPAAAAAVANAEALDLLPGQQCHDMRIFRNMTAKLWMRKTRAP
jgi:hypothetical protein